MYSMQLCVQEDFFSRLTLDIKALDGEKEKSSHKRESLKNSEAHWGNYPKRSHGQYFPTLL